MVGIVSFTPYYHLWLQVTHFRVTVEEHIGHDGEVVGASSDGSSETEDLSGEHVPDQTDGVLGLVVGWDGDVDILQWRVGIAESDDWDVDV